MTNLQTKKRILPIILTLTLLVAPLAFVHADENEDQNEDSQGSRNEDRQERIQERKDNFEEKKAQLFEEREEKRQIRATTKCEIRGKRIDNKINMFEKTHRFHVAKYQKIHDRIKSLIERLNTEKPDVDTTKLKEDLAKMQTKIDALNDKYKELVDSLNALKDEPCDPSTSFNNAFSDSKALLEEMRTMSLDIQNFFAKTIRQDLKDLKESLQAMKQENKEKDENEESSESENN